VALLVETGGFGQSGAKEAEATAGKYGITLVRREEYGQKDSDVTPQLTRLRNAPGVQAVFVIGFGQGAVMATRNYHQLGIRLPLYHAHGVASDEFIRLSGAAAEGVRLPSPGLLVADRLPADAPERPVVLSRKPEAPIEAGQPVGYAVYRSGPRLARIEVAAAEPVAPQPWWERLWRRVVSLVAATAPAAGPGPILRVC